MSKRLPQFPDTWQMERLNGGDWCGKKNLVCYASNKTDGIFVKCLTDVSEKKLTAGGSGESYPRFSPDGTKVLFVSSVPGIERQVFVCDIETGEAKQVSSINGAAMEPLWSPDGTRILFASSQGGEGKAPAAHPDDAIVIEDFHYKMDGAGYVLPDGHVQLFLSNVQTGETTRLTQGEFDFMHHAWAPDGKKICYCSNENRSRAEAIGFDLFVMDVSDEFGKATQISKNVMPVSYPNPARPVFTPDGSAVIMGVLKPDCDIRMGYPEVYLYRFEADGSGQKPIFERDETCFQCVQFPHNAFAGSGLDKVQIDSETGDIYFVAGWMGQGNLYRLKNGEKHAKPVISGKQCCHGLSAIQDGKMLFSQVKADQPEAYYLLDLRSESVLCKAVQGNRKITDEVQLSPVEDFFFQTLDGESRVHGFVMPPQNREEGKKYPTILYIHGGPHPFYTYGLTMEFQCFAAAGFGVIYCNPRGSSGYGNVHLNLQRARDGSAYTDCLQFVDEAVRRYSWIDGKRMGVTGGSYGGYMTNYMATHSSRFKAYVTQRSIANELITYASSDMSGSSREYRHFDEFMVHELEHSSVSCAERVHAPLLILHGEDDLRCPVEDAHQFFIAVKDLHPDLPVKLLIFPHTPHDQPSEPRLLARYYREMADWFTKYL